jgi:peptidoglycan L-alanyl-D-glutamate endopeptidase CwlK
MPRFGSKSRRVLEECDDRFIKPLTDVVRWFDIALVEGHRDKETQNKHFKSGASKVPWPRSKHNTTPSQAIHVMPYHQKYKLITGHPSQIMDIAVDNDWSSPRADAFVRETYAQMAGIVQQACRSHGFRVRWGGDWDQDNDTSDNKFDDLAHFEIVG